jgi:hypothetical protein
MSKGSEECMDPNLVHMNQLWEIPFMPVLLRESLPQSNRSPEEREQWHRVIMILFKPWHKIGNLKGAHHLGTNTFDTIKFKASLIQIMKNMNVEHEYKDA